MSITRIFTDHPAAVGETYGQHMGTALGFAGRLFLAACACAVHAVLPFCCTTTGSDTIRALHRRMVTHRRADAAPDAMGAEAD